MNDVHPVSKIDSGLQLADKTFAELILNFLGKKEELKYEAEKNFLVRLNDVEQFYFLLHAKISKEQGVFIDHFSVSITYNDGTVRSISGIDALKSFHETRDVVPIDITLSWNVLVKYPSSETIENQRIDLSFVNNKSEKDNGWIFLNIQHTNQAWGIEVLNLFKDKISNVSLVENKYCSFSKKAIIFFDIKVLISIFPILLFLMMIGGLNERKDYSSKDYYSIVQLMAGGVNEKESSIAAISAMNMNSEDMLMVSKELIKNESLQEALNKISDRKAGELRRAVIFIATYLSGVVVAVLAIWFYLKALMSYHYRGSHIIINTRSEQRYAKEVSSNGKAEFYGITFITVTVVTGILTAVITRILGFS